MWYDKKTPLLLYNIINIGIHAIYKHVKVTLQYSSTQYTVVLLTAHV